MKLELVEIDDAAPASAAPPEEDITVSPALAGPGAPASTLTLTLADQAIAAPAPPARDDATIDLRPLDRPLPKAPATPVKIDRYAQQASREYAQGHVDQPLWDRAMSQAAGDKAAAAAIYVRARGTALRLLDRDRDLDATRPLPPPPQAEPVAARRNAGRAATWRRYQVPVAAAVVLAVAAVATVFYLTGQDEPPRQAAPHAAARPATPVAAPAAAAPVAKADSRKELAALQAKIQELRDAGNWNVLVLYAVEWTRKEPDNAAAWNQLRAGYVYLRQYDDALAAARKAVQLAPNDAVLWRRLGEVNLDLDDAPAALTAFKEAVARDAADTDSLRAIGLLAARLGQPQEAKAAFDRALAAQPGDSVTVCLRNGAAQLPPARDAYTAMRQVSALDARCHGRAEGTAAVAAR